MLPVIAFVTKKKTCLTCLTCVFCMNETFDGDKSTKLQHFAVDYRLRAGPSDSQLKKMVDADKTRKEIASESLIGKNQFRNRPAPDPVKAARLDWEKTTIDNYKQWGLLYKGKNPNIRHQRFYVAGQWRSLHYKGFESIDPVQLLDRYSVYYLGLEKAPTPNGRIAAISVFQAGFVGSGLSHQPILKCDIDVTGYADRLRAAIMGLLYLM